jgi:hypothetical protein
MKKLLAVLALATACASSPQKIEYQTATTAAAAVEAARGAYYNLRVECTASPAILASCPQIVAAHDQLQHLYGLYQQAFVLLTDANSAALSLGIDPTQSPNVAAATQGLLKAAADFVTFKNSLVAP